jgi:hypothetical protein
MLTPKVKDTMPVLTSNNTSSGFGDTEKIMHYEQIIGIEYVCVIDWNTNKNETSEPNETTSTSMKLASTLTSDSGLNENELTIGAPATTSVDSSTSNKMATLKYKRQVQFCSKIDKFRFSCVLDLIASDESLKDFLYQINSVPQSNYVIRIFLRFNWYSFYELDMNNYFNMVTNPITVISSKQQQQLHQQQQQQQLQNHDHANKQTFNYNSMLLPKIDEFNWHLKEQMYQFETAKFSNLAEFHLYRNHIKQGVMSNYNSYNLKEVTKFVLSKHKTITTTSVFDAPPKTNASKLPPTLKTTTSTKIDEDKTVLNVDPVKFLAEFKELFKKLNACFYDAKLEQFDDKNYYMICNYRDNNKFQNAESNESNFRVLIKIRINRIQKKLGGNAKGKGNLGSSTSPTTFESQSASGSSITNEQAYLSANPGSSVAKPSVYAMRKPMVPADPHPKLCKTLQVTEELAINKFLIKSYFAFNHLNFEFDQSLIQKILADFKSELSSIINLTYLALVLKEIHDTRKWNNMLKLNGNYYFQIKLRKLNIMFFY